MNRLVAEIECLMCLSILFIRRSVQMRSLLIAKQADNIWNQQAL